MSTQDISTISALAGAYSAHTGLKESTVSTYALGDGKRLRLYRKGKADMTTARLAKTIRWFSENWPADLEWPQDIPRPSKSKPQEAA